MANTALKDKYLKVIRRLFPTGFAWERVFDSASNLSKLLDSYANETCRIDERGKELINEVDPTSTFELLEDWERLLGLPDECDPGEDQTLQERRTRVLQILTTRGGQNEDFYKELASNFGFDVDVISAEDQPPFLAGSKAGDRLTNGNWRYAFVINAPAEFLIRFRAGQGSAGDPLVKVGNDTLQCLMEKHKPAHTIVLFSFGDGEF
jgi:uncharacterized protein YmfQ (DUF2313 family)